jgi:hypothetical protein
MLRGRSMQGRSCAMVMRGIRLRRGVWRDDPGRRRRGQRRKPAEGGSHRRRQRQPGEDRRVAEPRDRAHHQPHLPERDVHEGPYEARIELRARAARDLGAAFGRAAGLLVGARGGDHVEHVGDRDDAAGEWNLLAADPAWIALAVPPLMVVADRLDPLAEPLAQRRDQRLAEERMPLELLPLLVARLAGLVEDPGADLELADVVQQRGPVQVVEVLTVQPQLSSEAVGVGPHAFRVAAGKRIVRIECCDQLQQDLGGFLRRRRLARPPEPFFEALDSARPHRDPEPRRRLVREDQREPEQRAKR